MPARALTFALAVLAVLVVGIGLAWALGLQQRVARLDAFCARQPANEACGSGGAIPSAAGTASTGSGSASPGASAAPSGGDPAVGGAIWMPPRVDDSASILIAASNSSEPGKERADVVVEGTADDEINQALRDLAQIGGGQVTLLEGRFELAQPVVIEGDGLSLVGVNVGNAAGYQEAALGSQIVAGPTFPAGQFLVQAAGEAYGPLISLVHVDGMNRAQGINVEGKRPTVTLNAVTKSSDVGIRFAGESTGNRPYDGFALFNRVFDGAGIGILNDQLSGDMLIEGNVVFRNGGDGFRCYGASEMYRVNHAYENEGVGLRLIPGCVRTRLSSNKWEGNSQGGVSIEGGAGFTIVGDTFADNENGAADAQAHLQIGVRGDTATIGVLAWGLSFGKGDDENPYLIEVGSTAEDVSIGPMFSSGGYTRHPVQVDPGGQVQFLPAGRDPIVEPRR
jgi:hypothetical protein